MEAASPFQVGMRCVPLQPVALQSRIDAKIRFPGHFHLNSSWSQIKYPGNMSCSRRELRASCEGHSMEIT